MQIGILCHASFGGSARVATNLAVELAQRGHRLHLFTRTTPFGGWDDASRVVLHTIIPNCDDNLHPASLHTDWPGCSWTRVEPSTSEIPKGTRRFTSPQGEVTWRWFASSSRGERTRAPATAETVRRWSLPRRMPIRRSSRRCPRPRARSRRGPGPSKRELS